MLRPPRPARLRAEPLTLAAVSMLAALVVLPATGCGRSELLSARRCPPSNPACQLPINPGLDGGVGIDARNGGSGGGSGGAGGRGGTGGRVDAGPDSGRCPTGTREICGNGRDDDCNALVDCLDPACLGDRLCAPPGQEVCNNTLDDDADRLVDCADPDCMGSVACRPTMGRETCDNGLDDNNDRLVDCSDPQCAMFPACLSASCSADVDFGSIAAHGARVSRGIDTRGTARAFTTCAPAGGHGRVARFSLAEPADVRVEITQPMGSAHVVGLFRAGTNQTCDRNPAGCLAAGDAPSAAQTFADLGAGVYWLIVESFPGTEGSSTVVLSTGTVTRPEICANGVDDDGNGLTDCQDLVCKNLPVCANSTCRPDTALGALVVGAPAKMVRVDLTTAPSRYEPTCSGRVPGGDTAISFTLPETGGVEVGYQQTGHTIFSLFRQPGPGLACDADQRACAFEEQRANAVAFTGLPAGQYILILKAVSSAEAGTLNLRISAFGNRNVEVCGNGIDDDANGLTDCADPSCAGVGNCNATACRPDVDLGAFGPGTSRTTVLDTRSAPDLYQTSCGRGNGKERVVRLSFTQPMALGVSCMGTGSHVIELARQLEPLDACNATDLGCADPEVLPFGCGYSIPGLQPGQYNVIVEAFQAGSEGQVTLTLDGIPETVREICTNGMDDDGDGAVDCADRKCVTSADCRRFACHPDKNLGILPLDGSVARVVVETAMGVDDQTRTACATAPGGQDGVVDFQIPADGTNVTLRWAQFGNHAFAVYTNDGGLLSCEAGRSIACVATGGAVTGTASFTLAAGLYHMVIDADRPGLEGPVAVELAAAAGNMSILR